MSSDGDLYLSVEISTQQLKVIIIDDGLNVVYEDGVLFEEHLPQYKTRSGATHHRDGKTVTAPVLMWVQAFDMAMERMVRRMKEEEDGGRGDVDLFRVVAVCGAAQQHGSVYWKKGSESILRSLDPHLSLHQQLKEAFSISDSPIWMDCSTDVECRDLEANLGGAEHLSSITGCRTYHRITGNQIKKIYNNHHQEYVDTERISLVSSFACTLILGRYAPIDFSDGSGMNLMDVRAKLWSEECLKAYGMKDLAEKLGPIVKAGHCLGTISPYMVDRYGFNPSCKVGAFTGDNPASLVGMKPHAGDVIISLGTSDTLMLWMDEYIIPCMDGLVLVNPLDCNAYMGLMCFKNGSLTRERVKDECQLSTWAAFEHALGSGPVGNHGNIGVYFHVPEITPAVQGILRWNALNERVPSFEPQYEIRALIEGQMMARRLHANKMGLDLDHTRRILATGGASVNKKLLQVMADVFNKPVTNTISLPNSACLGGAYLAKWVTSSKWSIDDDDNDDDGDGMGMRVMPNANSVQVYEGLIKRYENLEQSLMDLRKVSSTMES